MQFALRNYALILSSLFVLSACTEDPVEQVISDPRLDLRVTGPCAGAASAFSLGNVVPVISTDDLSVENFNPTNSGQILVEGSDPNTGTGDLTVETQTVVSLVGEDDGLIAGFASNAGLEPQSERLTFAGRSARDLIFCFAPGSVTVRATIESYQLPALNGEGGAGSDGAGETISLVSRDFKVSCVDAFQFEKQCGLQEEEMVTMGGMDEMVGGAGGSGGADDMIPMGGAGGAGGMETFEGPPNWSLAYVGTTDLVMGIRNSGLGRVDFLDLPFRLCDLRVGSSGGDGDCKPRAGVEVSLSLPQDSPPNVEVIPAVAVTDADGVATARIIAGGTPGVFSVSARATAPDSEQTLAARTPTIVIRGGVPSMRGFQLTCTPNVIQGFDRRLIEVNPNDPLALRDEYTFLTDGANTISSSSCTAKLSDRLSGRVDAETLVFFMAEAGTVTQAAAVEPDAGTATTLYTAGAPQPFDVEPLAYELEIDCPSAIEGQCGLFGTCDRADIGDACRGIENDPIAVNPRDGVVTVVAVTRGEELFYDVDGDRAYDADVDLFLPEYDLPEPYVDANDNGDYDPDLQRIGRGFCDECPRGEEFRDTNDNDQWDPGNGQWDNDTDIWEESRLLWTGSSDLERSRIEVTCLEEQGCSKNGPFPDSACRAGSADYYLNLNGRIGFTVRFGDRNGNCLDVSNLGIVTIKPDGTATLLEAIGDDTHPINGACWTFGDHKLPQAPTFSTTYQNVCFGNPDIDPTACFDGPKIAKMESQISHQGLQPPLNTETQLRAWANHTICAGNPPPPENSGSAGPGDGGGPADTAGPQFGP